MPFLSKRQARWAFANKKPWAKKWAKVTNFKSLPARVRKKKKSKRMRKARTHRIR